jgi:uncharacterized membrane protein YozB (DUF420 family)
MTISDLPTLNACLNGSSAVLLAFGYAMIRKGRAEAHRNCMIAAFITSSVFLVCYLVYHYYAGRTVFRDPAWFRPWYLTLLISHTILAVAILPLILITLRLAVKKRFEAHKKIARWTWPLWMYVSVTGVVVYLILYHIFPQH